MTVLTEFLPPPHQLKLANWVGPEHHIWESTGALEQEEQKLHQHMITVPGGRPLAVRTTELQALIRRAGSRYVSHARRSPALDNISTSIPKLIQIHVV